MDVQKNLKLQKAGNVLRKSLTILFLSIMALTVIIPFYWMLNTSFKTSNEVIQEPPTLYPHEWNFQNYRLAFLGKKRVTLEKYNKELAELPAKIEKQEKIVSDLTEGYENNKAEYQRLENEAKTNIKVKYPETYIDKYITLKDNYSYHYFLEKQEEEIALRNELAEQNKVLQELKTQLKKITDKESTEYQSKAEEVKAADKKYDEIKAKRQLVLEYIKGNEKKFNKEKNEVIKLKLEEIYTENYLKTYKPVFDYQSAESLLKTLKQRYEVDLPDEISKKNEEKSDNFGQYMLNTIIVGISSTLLGTFLSIIGAFALSRLKFKGREVIFSIMMATMMIPGEMMVISNFVTVTKAGWTDASSSFVGAPFFAMVVPFLVTVFHIYLLRQNFKQIPNELYYAAKVDGCSDFKYLWKVMVPLAKSSIITITILKVMGAWNAFIWPNLVAGENTKLITVWLRTSFQDTEAGRVLVEAQMAATVIVLIPLLLVFIFLRKYIMRGVSRGGTKG